MEATAPAAPSSWSSLPLDLLVEVLLHLDLASAVCCGFLVCRGWKQLSTSASADEAVWGVLLSRVAPGCKSPGYLEQVVTLGRSIAKALQALGDVAFDGDDSTSYKLIETLPPEEILTLLTRLWYAFGEGAALEDGANDVEGITEALVDREGPAIHRRPQGKAELISEALRGLRSLLPFLRCLEQEIGLLYNVSIFKDIKATEMACRDWTGLVTNNVQDPIEGLITIARWRRPMCEASGIRDELDRIAELARAECRPEVLFEPQEYANALAILEATNRVMFQELGFRPCDNDKYYMEVNSYIDKVLERRCGIPITMCCVYHAICSRLGLQLQLVGMPGHFVLALQAVETGSGLLPARVFIDVFHNGRLLSAADCRTLMSLIGVLNPDNPTHLLPSSVRQVWQRCLRNLKALKPPGRTPSLWAYCISAQLQALTCTACPSFLPPDSTACHMARLDLCHAAEALHLTSEAQAQLDVLEAAGDSALPQLGPPHVFRSILRQFRARVAGSRGEAKKGREVRRRGFGPGPPYHVGQVVLLLESPGAGDMNRRKAVVVGWDKVRWTIQGAGMVDQHRIVVLAEREIQTVVVETPLPGISFPYSTSSSPSSSAPQLIELPAAAACPPSSQEDDEGSTAAAAEAQSAVKQHDSFTTALGQYMVRRCLPDAFWPNALLASTYPDDLRILEAKLEACGTVIDPRPWPQRLRPLT